MKGCKAKKDTFVTELMKTVNIWRVEEGRIRRMPL